MAVAMADPSTRAEVPAPIQVIRILIVDECPLFRVGLRSLLGGQSDFHVVGETTHLEDVLMLAREHCPVVLLDGGLTSTDPLDLVRQLRQVGVQGIMVFAPPAADEETLFHFLRYGATAYEDGFISGEDLLAKLHRMYRGEYLVTSDVLFAQAARRERLAHLRQALLPAAHPNEADPAVGAPSLLTERERAILEQIARGCTTRQAARALGISLYSVKTLLPSTYRKLAVSDRTEAVVVALCRGWIAVEGADLPADRL